MAVLPGKRVRDNSIFGTLTSGISAVTSSISSVELADLSAISSDHAIITLDPFRQFGDPEIVMVVTHTASSTSAGVQRGMYGTVARAHSAGVQWAHAATVEDFADVVTSSTLPSDSFEGQMVYQTDTDSYRYFDGVTWRTLGAGAASFLGYAQITAFQTGITTEVDITGLSVTVTVPEGRRLRIRAHTTTHATAAGGRNDVNIKEGATVLQRGFLTPVAVTTAETLETIAIITPTAGTHTYKLSAARPLGAGTMTVEAGTDFPAFILVEDITGSESPHAAQNVPVGVIGQGLATSNVTGITTVTVLASTNVVVPAGRLLKVSVQAGPGATDGTTGMFGFIRMDGGNIGRWVRQNSNPADSSGRHHVGFVTISPSAGAHTFDATLEKLGGAGTVNNEAGAAFPTIILVEDVTPTPTPSSGAPSSTLAYAEVTTTQSGITSQVDLTGLSVTFTVPAGRRIKVTASCGLTSTIADDRFTLLLLEGATTLQNSSTIARLANTIFRSVPIDVVLSPSAGTHTYKLAALRGTGTGSLGMDADVTRPAFILVEDITGSIWPQGSQVTSGIIASEAWQSWTPILTNMTLGAGTLTGAYMKIGRTVHYRLGIVFGAGMTMGVDAHVSPPVPISSAYIARYNLGQATLVDTGVDNRNGMVWYSSGLLRILYWDVNNVAAAVTTTAPFTWVSTDQILLTGTYEAAS